MLMKRKELSDSSTPCNLSQKLKSVYIFKDGLRSVNPYLFTYKCFIKGRWIGLLLFKLFCKEFLDRPKEYYEKAILNGKIRINDQKVGLDYVIKSNDYITHEMIRDEPDVLDEPIEIIHRDDKLMVVNKPSSYPIYPAGRYNHNSLFSVLEEEYGLQSKTKGVINRLDRLTSGIVLIGLTKESLAIYGQQMRDSLIRKTYICKVNGRVEEWDAIQCEKKIKIVDFKTCKSQIDEESGKDCVTKFKVLKREQDSTFLLCYPMTGRTHQIRVHLQYLGFPIFNDPMYGEKVVPKEYICLHAWIYSSSEWRYQTRTLPFWAHSIAEELTAALE